MAHSKLQQRTLKHCSAGDKPKESKETGDSSEVNKNVVPKHRKISAKYQENFKCNG